MKIVYLSLLLSIIQVNPRVPRREFQIRAPTWRVSAPLTVSQLPSYRLTFKLRAHVPLTINLGSTPSCHYRFSLTLRLV
ncbi:uncharacterized protein P174DRAFT_1436 [Aspergillus novofumigatus IBT 16806]|uniref:Uncharacterized protein n=1 Tax=Aspergillus novofumigatus (strain IBT 16806) TaxID=1392255 RepID=A0A2I1CK67_ASPN1|nr:uncharacterized protein P174DRAFT_1436 [Aspergillus novofumigatus IBT 16806]PKX97998.1 hypothetical protein P174DRAFT_1436 [Aspergillus novofumigatus IBT 16806]